MSTVDISKNEKTASKTQLVIPKSSREGNPVTFKATVEGTPSPTGGTVIFWDGSKKIGEAQLDESGAATLTRSSLKWGKHSITAFYSGSDNHLASESETRVHRVKATFEDRQRKWSSIQSAVTAAALLLAIVGAVITFAVQNIVRIEGRGAAMNIDVSAQADAKGIIRGKVTIKNLGNTRETLYLGCGPLFLAKVCSIPTGARISANIDEHGNITTGNDGKILLGTPQKFWFSQPFVDDPERSDIPLFDEIRAQSTSEYPFIIRVQESGTYALMFSALPSDQEQARLWRDHPGLNPHQWRWEPAPVFVEVKMKEKMTNAGCNSKANGPENIPLPAVSKCRAPSNHKSFWSALFFGE